MITRDMLSEVVQVEGSVAKVEGRMDRRGEPSKSHIPTPPLSPPTKGGE